MAKILDIGNCGPDHAALTKFFGDNFDASVEQADQASDALPKMRAAAEAGAPFDLAVVNRKLDIDYTDGIDVIKQIKADPALADSPVMLITNFAEHQDAAEAAGALRGFGKLEYDDAGVIERVRAALA